MQGVGILSHREFCTEILRSENEISFVTISLTCLDQEPSEPNLYLPGTISIYVEWNKFLKSLF